VKRVLYRWIVGDTNFWVGLADKRDQFHDISVELQSELDECHWVVTDYIIDETMTMINRRRGFQPALDFYDFFTSRCRVLWLAPNELEACREIFATYGGALSFTDAAIVRCMQREGLRYLLSFDRRFDRVEGLTRVHRPGQLAPDDG